MVGWRKVVTKGLLVLAAVGGMALKGGDTEVTVTNGAFYSFVEPWEHWKTSPAWYRLRRQSYWTEAIKVFKYEGVRERLGMPKSVKWIELERDRKYQKKTYRLVYENLKRRYEGDLLTGLPREISLPIGWIGLNLINKYDSQKFEKLGAEKTPHYHYLMTIMDRNYHSETDGLIEAIYKTEGIRSVVVREIRDTLLYFRRLGKVRAKKLTLEVELDTLNPYTYIFSPLGAIYTLRWHEKTYRELRKGKLVDNRYLNSYMQFILFSSYVEACNNYEKASAELREEGKELEQLEKILGQNMGWEERKRLNNIKLVFTPDSCAKYLSKDYLRWGTRGGALVLVRRRTPPYVGYYEEKLKAWNTLGFWDGDGFPLKPRRSNSDWDWRVIPTINYYGSSVIVSTPYWKDTVVIYFIPNTKELWDKIESKEIPSPDL